MRSRTALVGGGITLLFLMLVNTCRQQATPPPDTTGSTGSTGTASAETAAELVNAPPSAWPGVSASGAAADNLPSQTSEAADQLAVVTAQDPASEVNVRSLPSPTADAIGYGRVGDVVTLGKAETAEDGHTWNYVTFQDGTTVGWIRSDFLEPQAPAEGAAEPATVDNSATAQEVLKTVLDEQCGNVKAIEAYFITQNYTLYLCQVRGQRLFLSQEKGTEQVIQAQEVVAIGGGYIVTNGDYEYRLDSTSFVVIRIDPSGKQEEVLREPVVYTERY